MSASVWVVSVPITELVNMRDALGLLLLNFDGERSCLIVGWSHFVTLHLHPLELGFFLV